MKKLLDITVVTSCHNYGRYFTEWARSIVELTCWPSVVAMVDNGSTDATSHNMEDSARMLREAGLPDVRTERTPLTDFGTARNAAVALGAGTEWVMHMDVDDMFMPHCLADIEPIMPGADVIPLGYERCGDLAAGPANRTRVYRSSRGKSTLQSTAPASGVSPFRRSFWERSPYRTDMIGGWDTALWIGFAHLDARFVAAKRPCFFYRQHADSIFNTRRIHRRRGRMVGAKLTNLRRRRHGVSILVPRRGDGGGSRDRAWEWVRARYDVLYPDWEVVEGNCAESGPWRKGVAVADALEKSRGNTIIIADSDCVLPREALLEAVRLVEVREAPWVIPHLLVHRMDRDTSHEIITARAPESTEPPFTGEYSRKPYVGFPGGGFIVIDASRWSATGGMPFSFAGWGAEDEATAEILDTLVGPNVRLEYDLWHLWHPHARKGNQGQHGNNRALLSLFRSLAGDPDNMFEAMERLEAGTPLDALFSAGRGTAVAMVALMDFARGTEKLKKHQRFIATEEEAKRHEARPRKIAMRVSSAPAAILRGGKERTLELRSEQYQRNEAARAAEKSVITKQEA